MGINHLDVILILNVQWLTLLYIAASLMKIKALLM